MFIEYPSNVYTHRMPMAIALAMAMVVAMAKAMAIATVMAKQIQGISKNHAKAHFCNICNKVFSLLFSEKMSEPDFCLSC